MTSVKSQRYRPRAHSTPDFSANVTPAMCRALNGEVCTGGIFMRDPGDRRRHEHGDRGCPGDQGVGRQGRRGARKLAWDYTTSTPLSASIRPTSENWHSPNFAFWGFCEVRIHGVLRSLQLAVCIAPVQHL